MEARDYGFSKDFRGGEEDWGFLFLSIRWIASRFFQEPYYDSLLRGEGGSRTCIWILSKNFQNRLQNRNIIRENGKTTTVVRGSGEPLGKRVSKKYRDRRASHLAESRFSFFFFFSFVLFPCDRWLPTSSIECPFPSFISGNYRRLPSGKTVSSARY